MIGFKYLDKKTCKVKQEKKWYEKTEFKNKYLEITCECPICGKRITIEGDDLEVTLYKNQIYYINGKAIRCKKCGYIADFIIINQDDVDDKVQFERICLNDQCDFYEKSYFFRYEDIENDKNSGNRCHQCGNDCVKIRLIG